MHVIVLGAGVIGVTSAWFLAEAGHRVTVLDRQSGAALETSFANGGQISVGHAEPWANPSAPLKILKWLGREDAPLLFRLRADLQQWRWGLAFLRECLPGRTRENTRRIVILAAYSRDVLRSLRAQAGIDYDHLERGILHLYSEPGEFDAACTAARWLRQFGCERDPKTPAECVAIEPALAPRSDRLAGGLYTPTDESGDAHRFTVSLAERAAQRGVEFCFGTPVTRLLVQGGEIAGVKYKTRAHENPILSADAYVVALGSYSPLLLRTIGVRIPVYPAKGYSNTFPIADPARAPNVSLTDEDHKIVFSRLGERLRVAGTAELTGYSTELNMPRCEALTKRTRELFPEACDWQSVSYWAGLRPATPSNVPVIGRTRYRNLYLNTGHGTLGWTLACGSGKVLTNLIDGKQPEVDFPFLR
jgi:D-amino-acid dehydrogenase